MAGTRKGSRRMSERQVLNNRVIGNLVTGRHNDSDKAGKISLAGDCHAASRFTVPLTIASRRVVQGQDAQLIGMANLHNIIASIYLQILEGITGTDLAGSRY
jgi:hypothetical protein